MRLRRRSRLGWKEQAFMLEGQRRRELALALEFVRDSFVLLFGYTLELHTDSGLKQPHIQHLVYFIRSVLSDRQRLPNHFISNW